MFDLAASRTSEKQIRRVDAYVLSPKEFVDDTAAETRGPPSRVSLSQLFILSVAESGVPFDV